MNTLGQTVDAFALTPQNFPYAAVSYYKQINGTETLMYQGAYVSGNEASRTARKAVKNGHVRGEVIDTRTKKVISVFYRQ